MKRLLFVVLIMVCSVSWAGWEMTGSSHDGTYTVYYDKSTIRRTAAIVKMWILEDFSFEQIENGARFNSTKQLRGYNCREETTAFIAITKYVGSMGGGKVVDSVSFKEEDWTWKPIVPGTFGESQWKIVCGKK